jgi:hypothetical protein
MKTTVDLPAPLLEQAKSAAAQSGISLKILIREAIEHRVQSAHEGVANSRPYWTELLAGLPVVSPEVLREVHRRVSDADHIDLNFQKEREL